jgi:hypothetical protein
MTHTNSTRQSGTLVATALVVALLMSGCATVKGGVASTPLIQSAPPASAPAAQRTAQPSAQPTAKPPVATPKPSPAVVAPSAKPLSDAAKALAVTQRYENALIAGRWQVAWDILSSAQQSMRGTLANFVYERAAYFDRIDRYTLSRPTHNAAVLKTWTTSRDLVRGANLARAYVIQVDYPQLANNNAGWEVLLVAPDSSGAWRIWYVR